MGVSSPLWYSVHSIKKKCPCKGALSTFPQFSLCPKSPVSRQNNQSCDMFIARISANTLTLGVSRHDRYYLVPHCLCLCLTVMHKLWLQDSSLPCPTHCSTAALCVVSAPGRRAASLRLNNLLVPRPLTSPQMALGTSRRKTRTQTPAGQL